MARSFLFLTSSGRPDGNTEALARAAAAALPAGTTQRWRDLSAPMLPPFHDLRHGGESYAPPEGAAAELMAETLAATDIVVVAPLYWYGLPAPAKLYLDHWSHWMRLPGLGFRAAMEAKTLWGVVVHSGSTPEQIAPAVEALRFSAEYMPMRWGGALLGYANRPGEIAADAEALAQARTFFAA